MNTKSKITLKVFIVLLVLIQIIPVSHTNPTAEENLEIQASPGIKQILENHKPKVVAVEQLYAHYKHPRTAILMGHARGVIFQKAAESGADVKSFATFLRTTV